MAETKQIQFELAEAATALLKDQGIHEGLWAIGFEFGLGVGNFGPSPDTVKPAAMLQVSRLLLVRHTEGEPAHFVVDAAKVNPKSKPARVKQSQKA